MDAQSSIRIIGGKWRSRKVSFITKDALRPTPDRVRETLFNWLAPYIHGAVCLDLYAGSGVLGLEALSRGAQSVVALENDRDNYQKILQAKEILQADTLEVLHKNVLDWLQTPKFTADIIFVDPPYKQEILIQTLQLLEANNWVSPDGMIYFEQDKPLELSELPANWTLWRNSKASKVYYFLAMKES
jgi:16S rRNA (guanine966-N2)-methyltransferase